MSVLGTTQVIVLKPDNTIYKGPISKLIDPLCSNLKDMISEVIDIEGYKILGVGQNNEKNNWNEISQISRHPANGKLVKVTTKSGKTTTATLSHSFLKRKEDGIIPTLGSELKVGDRIPVVKFTPEIDNFLQKFDEFNLTKELPKEKDLAQLIDTGRVKIKWDEFYLEEVEVIENEMGF